MIIAKNTSDALKVKNVISTLAVDNMYLSESFVKELLKVSNGEKSSEQLRQEVLKKYSK